MLKRAERCQGGNEMNKEEEIRLIAYSLWVRDGYPHGRAVEHWLKAESIWETVHNQGVRRNVTLEERWEEADEAVAIMI